MHLAGCSFIYLMQYLPTYTKLTGATEMRIVGKRKERGISPVPSGTLLAAGARFNDEIHRLPTGNTTFIPKGLYRFMSHAEANQHQLDCLAKGMAQLARERLHG